MKKHYCFLFALAAALLCSVLCGCDDSPKIGTNNIDEMPLGTNKFASTMYNNYTEDAGTFTITEKRIKFNPGSGSHENVDKLDTQTALDNGWSISDSFTMDPDDPEKLNFTYTLFFTKDGETSYKLVFNGYPPHDVNVSKYFGETQDEDFAIFMTWSTST